MRNCLLAKCPVQNDSVASTPTLATLVTIILARISSQYNRRTSKLKDVIQTWVGRSERVAEPPRVSCPVLRCTYVIRAWLFFFGLLNCVPAFSTVRVVPAPSWVDGKLYKLFHSPQIF